jgi:dihydrolipoamide dehydrogenase
MLDQMMATRNEHVSEVLEKALPRDGIRLHLGATAKRVRHGDGLYRLTLDEGTTLEGDALIVATGRTPNTGALKPEKAGIDLTEEGFVHIGDDFQSSREGVYAIGEVAGQPAFTHVSWEDHRRLLAILDGEDRKPGDRVLGYAAFTEPQVGRAGRGVKQAKEEGIEVRTARMEVAKTARALEWNHDLGFFEMVIDRSTDRILGATLVGYEAAELVHVFIDLIEQGATWRELERAQHIHPTYAENLPSLARKFSE